MNNNNKLLYLGKVEKQEKKMHLKFMRWQSYGESDSI